MRQSCDTVSWSGMTIRDTSRSFHAFVNSRGASTVCRHPLHDRRRIITLPDASATTVRHSEVACPTLLCIFDSTAGATGGHQPPVSGSGFAPLLLGDGRNLPSPSQPSMHLGRFASVPGTPCNHAFSASVRPNARKEVRNEFGVLDGTDNGATSYQGFKGRPRGGPTMRSSCRGTAMTRGGARCQQRLAIRVRRARASAVPPANLSSPLLEPSRRSMLPPSSG